MQFLIFIHFNLVLTEDVQSHLLITDLFTVSDFKWLMTIPYPPYGPITVSLVPQIWLKFD